MPTQFFSDDNIRAKQFFTLYIKVIKAFLARGTNIRPRNCLLAKTAGENYCRQSFPVARKQLFTEFLKFPD